MPNWAYTNVTVKGTKKEIHNVVKLGLVNSNIPENQIPDDLTAAFNLLLEQGKTKVGLKEDAPEKNDWEKETVGVTLENGVTMQTFFPMPDSYILYDTTNHPNSAPDEVLAEQEALGAIGWYDYNLKYLGTKWNADLENLTLNIAEGKDEARITFRLETAWGMPDRFFARLTEQFHDIVLVCEGTEESCAYFVVVVFKDGEGFDYADLSKEWNDMCDEWHNKREALKKEGKTEDEIDDEVGEYIEDTNMYEKLDLKYEKAVEEIQLDTDLETLETE